MAIDNSYQRSSSGQVTILADRQRSYKSLHGANVVIIAKPWESYARGQAFGDVDSSDTVQPRIENYIQRPGANKGDVSGKIYNSNGGGIALVSLHYSQVGLTGPWLALTILSGDPLYSFPAIGTPAGETFNIPVEISAAYTGNVWFKIVVSSPLPNQEDINGPFAFAFVNPIPPAPAYLTVPTDIRGGNVGLEWAAVASADYYTLQVATDPLFSDARTIYIGPDISFTDLDKDEGTYYYRVSAGNVYGDSGWTDGSNSITVSGPDAPAQLIVPAESTDGQILVSWTLVEDADFFELQESSREDFADAKTIYTGKENSLKIEKGRSGKFYYRVRSGYN